MYTFKGYLTEATKQQLWSDAIGSKPEKYGAGFVDLVKADHTFDLLDGSDAVVLDKSNTKLLDVFSGALSKETLINDILAADPDQKVIKWNKTKSGKYQSPKWKVVASNNNIDYIPINHLGKDSVKPSSTPSGGEWESMISIGYNITNLHLQPQSQNEYLNREHPFLETGRIQVHRQSQPCRWFPYS